MAMRRDMRRPWPDIFDWAEGLPGLLSWPAREAGSRSFRIEEFDEDGRYLVRAEIPGVNPATDISVQVDQGVLTIGAERVGAHGRVQGDLRARAGRVAARAVSGRNQRVRQLLGR